MKEIWNQQGKECRPEQTVDRIQEILKRMDIETEHVFTADVMESCYSSRVTVQGEMSAVYGTNGKGITREYCMASAYAEFMERLENRGFPYSIHACDREGLMERYKRRMFPVHNIEEDFDREGSYASWMMDYILENSGMPNHFFNRQLVKRFLGGNYEYQDFYHVQAGSYEKVPSLFAKLFTHSNGMAAGNTLEEAIVQAVSEILERVVQTRIMTEGITPPDIPADILARYPHVRKILDEIKGTGIYEVYLKDCSLGGAYPVAACFMVDKENQTLGIRFGSHPNMGIALERTLTEAFQGRDMKQFTGSSWLSFDPQVCRNRSNLLDTKKIGNGAYPCEILGETKSYTFKDWDYGTRYDNQELAEIMVDILVQQGHEVYIRDNSNLGFPAVYVVAAGASEIRCCDLLYLKEMKLSRDVMKSMIELEQMTREKVNDIIRLIQIKHHALMENTISSIYKLPFDHHFYTFNEVEFLLFVCYYYLEDYEKAEKALSACKVLPEEVEHVKTIKKYLSARRQGYSREKTLEILRTVCRHKLVEQVDEELKDSTRVFTKFYPVCRDFDCARCNVSYCRYPGVKAFERKII